MKAVANAPSSVDESVASATAGASLDRISSTPRAILDVGEILEKIEGRAHGRDLRRV